MASDAVLNIRLPKELKEHGNQVLKKNRTSVTRVVKDLYEYMEREQKIPECLVDAEEESIFDKRRVLLRQVVRSSKTTKQFDADKAKRDYLLEKYGEAL